MERFPIDALQRVLQTDRRKVAKKHRGYNVTAAVVKFGQSFCLNLEISCQMEQGMMLTVKGQKQIESFP